MRLARSPFVMVADAGELPTPEKFVADADAALASLKELRVAPIVDEEYRGPVLFDADAAADVFAELVGNNVDGPKPEPGTSARTSGDFASSYKSRVLPDFVTVVDDPTQKSFQGHSLVGSYAFDDEGVKDRVCDGGDKRQVDQLSRGPCPDSRFSGVEWPRARDARRPRDSKHRQSFPAI